MLNFTIELFQELAMKTLLSVKSTVDDNNQPTIFARTEGLLEMFFSWKAEELCNLRSAVARIENVDSCDNSWKKYNFKGQAFRDDFDTF